MNEIGYQIKEDMGFTLGPPILDKQGIARRMAQGLPTTAHVSKEDEMDSDFIDPLKLMIISRPNTGKNPCEMTSSGAIVEGLCCVSS